MSASQSKISKSSLLSYRPLTCGTPLQARQNNFLLDCVSKQNSTLPNYRIEDDAFVKPYIATILSKVKSGNLATPSITEKSSFKVRKVNPAKIDGQKFRAFLAQKMRQVSKRMEDAKITELSSCKNSPEKENLKQTRQPTKEEMFISAKYSCYKPRSRPKLPNRAKNIDGSGQK